ncbi:MAG: SdrD B-like domain-containing protein, partial [Candidatus Thermoplasmatota archaeon]|nr:SdrD B-like domain-containing protein [Candidatus Thermoplasmatota archaeon]
MTKTRTICILFLIGTILFLSLTIQSTADCVPDYAKVGDTVWYDVNEDGIQDPNEQGIEGVKVTLYCYDNSFYDNTTTDNNGKYFFYPIPANEQFYLHFELPDGYCYSPQHQGSDPEKDSDANITTGKTEIFSLSADEIDLSWDAGMYQINPNIEIEKWVKDQSTQQWVKQIQTSLNVDVYFRIVFTNTGNVPLHEITIIDTLSQQLSYNYDSNIPPYSASNNKIIWKIEL